MHRNRFHPRPMATIAAILLVLPLTGCIDLLSGNDLELTLDVSSTTVRPDAPITLTVTATNESDERIVWGQGSSSCQLSAVVAVGTDLFPIDIRACTDDLAPQGLDPKESRDEAWPWNGEIIVQNTLDTLPPGDYRIWATAGEVARSNLKTITVRPIPAATVHRP